MAYWDVFVRNLIRNRVLTEIRNAVPHIGEYITADHIRVLADGDTDLLPLLKSELENRLGTGKVAEYVRYASEYVHLFSPSDIWSVIEGSSSAECMELRNHKGWSMRQLRAIFAYLQEAARTV